MISITGSNVTVMVKNMDKAVAFYESIGLVLQQRWGDHYAMIGTEGITIGLHPSEGGETSSGSVSIGFMIADIADAKTLLDKNGISYDFRDGKSGKYTNFTDPDGTLLYFVQPGW